MNGRFQVDHSQCIGQQFNDNGKQRGTIVIDFVRRTQHWSMKFAHSRSPLGAWHCPCIPRELAFNKCIGQPAVPIVSPRVAPACLDSKCTGTPVAFTHLWMIGRKRQAKFVIVSHHNACCSSRTATTIRVKRNHVRVARKK